MRYDIAVRTLGDEFKLNNNFRSRYTRLLLRKRPEFKGFLATRALAEK